MSTEFAPLLLRIKPTRPTCFSTSEADGLRDGTTAWSLSSVPAFGMQTRDLDHSVGYRLATIGQQVA